MELKYRTSSSMSKPASIEKAKHTVFLRKNFQQNDGLWTYDEAKLSHDEYSEYVDGLVMAASSNTDQIIEGQVIGDDNQLIIMEAIADLYDAIANLQLGGAEE